MAKIKNLYRTPPAPREDDEQRAFFRWVDFMISSGNMPELETIFAIPNSGSGPLKGMAGKMKGLGMRAGVCDIFWPFARGGYHGLFIEMKRIRGGRVSPKQKEFMCLVRDNGYRAVVAEGYDDAQAHVMSYSRMCKTRGFGGFRHGKI